MEKIIDKELESEETKSDESILPETEIEKEIIPTQSSLSPEPTSGCSSKRQKIIWCLVGLIVILGICLIKIL